MLTPPNLTPPPFDSTGNEANIKLCKNSAGQKIHFLMIKTVGCLSCCLINSGGDWLARLKAHNSARSQPWDLAECGWDIAVCGWDLAEWLERLRANAVGFDPSILRHSGIWGAADDAVLNIVDKKKKNPKKSPFKIEARNVPRGKKN